MKKLLILIFVILFTPFSTVFAFDFAKVNLKTSLCAVETSDLYELSFYSVKTNLTNSDKLAIEKILNKIRKNKSLCYQKISKIKNLDNTFPFINNQEVDSCLALDNLKEKNSHYLNLLNFTLEELNKKGYQNEQQLKDIIKIINEEIAKIHPFCKAKIQLKNFPNPISAIEIFTILNYYKDQTVKLCDTYRPANSIISSYKDLNEKINSATKEHLINYSEFSIDDLLSFIFELNFEKGIINFNGQSLQTSEEKTFNYFLDNLPVKIITNGVTTKLQYKKITVIFGT